MSRLDELLAAYEADALDDAEHEELIALLGEPANRARLVELTRISAALARPDALPLTAARPRSARVLVFAAIAAIAAALVVATRLTWSTAAARVESATGATIAGAAAAAGMRVADGAAIAVGDGGALALRLADGSALRFGDGARATLAERASLVALDRGALSATVAHRDPARPLRVRTALAEATVVGTVLEVDAGADATRVAVSEGRVRVAAGSGDAVAVDAGRALEVERDAPSRLVAAGATRYVAIGDAAADDAAADGSEAHPWRTLARAVRDLRPGDRVLVKRGVYREAVALRASGAVDAPITVAAYPGHEREVVISGCDRRDDLHDLGGGRFSFAWHERLDAQYPADWPTPGAVEARCELVIVDGERLEQVASSDALHPGSFWVDDASARIVVATRDGAAPRALEAATRQSGLTVAGDRLRLVGLVVAGVADPSSRGALQVDGDGVELVGCVARDNALDGIRLSGRMRVAGCRADGNGRYGIAASLSDSEIVGCATDGNGWRIGPDYGGGVYLGGGAPTRTRIVAHRAARNRGRGIRLVWDCRECAVERCVLDDDVIAGIEIAACVGPNRIVGDVVRGTRAWHGTQYEHATGAGIVLREAGSVLIAHDTLVGNERYGLLLSGGVRDNGASTRACRIVGDVFADNGVAGIATWLWQGSIEALSTNEVDRNLYWQPHGAVAQDGDAMRTLDAWRAATGFDRASVAAEPRFLDADGRIGPGSPAVGLAPDGLGGRDADGRERPASHADAGAFQHAP